MKKLTSTFFSALAVLVSSAALHAQQGPAGYRYAVDENGSVNVSGTTNIAYGANGSFHYLYNQTQDIRCSNDVFGDPIRGTRKACYVQSAANGNPPRLSFANPNGNLTVDEGYALSVTVNASDTDGSVSNVKLYVDNALVRQESVAPYEWGAQAAPDELNGLSEGDHTIKAVATDNDGNAAETSFTLSVRGGRIQLPGTVQAEDYTNFSDQTPGNSGGDYRNDDVDIETTSDSGGGYNVGWTSGNEWLEFPVNVRETGNYRIEARVSSRNGGGMFTIEFSGRNLGNAFNVASTNDWQNFRTVSQDVGRLTAGTKTMRLQIQNGGFNVNWIRFTRVNANPTPTPTPPPTGCTLNTPARGIPDMSLFTVVSKRTTRNNFCSVDRWYDESAGRQVFSLFNGDNFATRNPGGRRHARTEAQTSSFRPGNTWHEFEARLEFNTQPDNTITLAQLFAGCCGPDARVEIRTNGRIHLGSLKDGNVPLSDNSSYVGRSFKIKIRSNGKRLQAFFNGQLKYEGETRRFASGEGGNNLQYHFRWGVYSNEIPRKTLRNTVTEIRLDL